MPKTTHSPRPPFSETDAYAIANSIFKVTSAKIKELPGDRDRNFYIRSGDGAEFTLKIANADMPREVLDLQNNAMTAVANNLSPAQSPRLRPAKSGETMVTVEDSTHTAHFVRLLTYLPGVPLARFKPHTPELQQAYGSFLGNLGQALRDFQHPASKRYLKWDLQHAPEVIRQHLDHIATPARRELVASLLEQTEAAISPQIPHLRTSIIHNDANDYNILVNWQDIDAPFFGIIDFGDIVETYTICELAIALAYVVLDKADPVAAASRVVQGYHAIYPLTEIEVETLFHFVCLRLCLSVSMSAYQQKMEPDNSYLTISEKPAWAALEKLRTVHPRFATAAFRHACGWPAIPKTMRITAWLKKHAEQIGPVLKQPLSADHVHVFDLSIDSVEFAEQKVQYDADSFTALLFEAMREKGATVGIGRYNEARRFYAGEAFKSNSDGFEEWRTIHIGMDLFAEAGTTIHAPLDGHVHSFRDNDAPFDYGPAIIIEHRFEQNSVRFFTLYGHLSKDSLEGLAVGMPVRKGQALGKIGDLHVNGGWPPHLHFQIIGDLFGREGEFPGVAPASQRSLWLSLCPDPNLILQAPKSLFPPEKLSQPAMLAMRQQHLGKSLSLSYPRPLTIVRGAMQYLFDDTGRRYLDAVNNVPHVGHCHPQVVAAGQQQMRTLNTNTRYLHESILRYAVRLSAKMPAPLCVCFFVNSGSEANELALRLARTYTGKKDVIVLDHGYHGNSAATIEISPYKFNRAGGAGKADHVHIAALPDLFRGLYRADDPQAAHKYAAHVRELIEAAHTNGRAIAAFIGESLPGCAGQIVLPDGYLSNVYQSVREAGGVCIADEVQVGFGRVGTHFWGFETQDVVPDIVTMGKPMGNGHPLGAVITTPDIAEAFANGMEYFNTFGGNPVSCAIGKAVLDVIENENLQQHALQTGGHFRDGLKALQAKHRLLDDVRGLGLFIGVELVRDRDTLEPAAAEARYIVNRMKEMGILISTDGPLENVLKIKPPLCFSRENADTFIATLDEIFNDSVLQRPF